MTRRRPLPRAGIAAALLAAFACEPAYTGYGAHACALLEDASVWCWGYDARGQLGDGTTADRARPAPVAGLPPARAVAAGIGFTCAVTADGAAWCWGRDDHGQLGDAGPGPDRATPAPVAGLAGARRVAAGVTAACAVLDSGAVSCWGRLGTIVRPVPEPVSGLPAPAVDVAVGWRLACALLAGGEVWCWGGDDRASRAAIPLAASLAIPFEAPCAILQDGSVGCAPPATPPALPSTAIALSGGLEQACAVLADGTVSCWGTRPFGPPHRFSQAQPFGPEAYVTGATAVSVGDGYACARLATGGVACWGDNWSGQLGDGTDVRRTAPVAVVGLPGPASAVTTARGVFVWDHGCGTTAAPDESL